MFRRPLPFKRSIGLVALSALVMGVAVLVRAYAAPYFLDLGIPFGMAWSVVAACVLLGLVASVFGGAAAVVFCVRRLVRGGL
jgi:hypothetical protein